MVVDLQRVPPGAAQLGLLEYLRSISDELARAEASSTSASAGGSSGDSLLHRALFGGRGGVASWGAAAAPLPPLPPLNGIALIASDAMRARELADLALSLEPPLTLALRPNLASLHHAAPESSIHVGRASPLSAGLASVAAAQLGGGHGTATQEGIGDARGDAAASALGRGGVPVSVVGPAGKGVGAGAGRAAATTLVADRAEMRRWALQLARQRMAQRRRSQLGMAALGHNLLWSGALMAWCGMGYAVFPPSG